MVKIGYVGNTKLTEDELKQLTDLFEDEVELVPIDWKHTVNAGDFIAYFSKCYSDYKYSDLLVDNFTFGLQLVLGGLQPLYFVRERVPKAVLVRLKEFMDLPEDVQLWADSRLNDRKVVKFVR